VAARARVARGSAHHFGADPAIVHTPSGLLRVNSGEARGGFFQITDLSGREVLSGRISGSDARVDAERLPAGVYVTRIRTGSSHVNRYFMRVGR
jgi:hypothetical protein